MKKLYLSLILLFCGKAFCGTYSISVADLNSRGWYSEAGVRTTSAQGNYIVGSPGATAEYRNFFIFDLSTIPSTDIITSVSFVIYNTPYLEGGFGGYNSFDASEVYQLYSIDYTANSVLRSDSSDLISAFDDLGDGNVLNSGFSFTTGSSDTENTILLNQEFITIAQASIGGEVALGGRITSLTLGDLDGELLFSGSHGLSLGSTRLVVTTIAIPEVSSSTLIVALLSLVYLVINRNRSLTSRYRQ